MSDLLHPVPLGIALGLFVGKQLGVFGFAALSIKLGLASLPKGVSWASLYGLSVLSGVGFTMSLFISSLAFESAAADIREMFDERLGIILGSLISAVVGFVILHRSLPRQASGVDPK